MADEDAHATADYPPAAMQEYYAELQRGERVDQLRYVTLPTDGWRPLKVRLSGASMADEDAHTATTTNDDDDDGSPFRRRTTECCPSIHRMRAEHGVRLSFHGRRGGTFRFYTPVTTRRIISPCKRPFTKVSCDQKKNKK